MTYWGAFLLGAVWSIVVFWIGHVTGERAGRDEFFRAREEFKRRLRVEP